MSKNAAGRPSSGARAVEKRSGNSRKSPDESYSNHRTNSDRTLKRLEEQRIKKATGIAGRLFKAPPPPVSIFLIILFSWLCGLISPFELSVFIGTAGLNNIYFGTFVFGIIFFAGPAVIVGLIIAPTVNSIKGYFSLQRGLLMALASVVIFLVILFFAWIMRRFFVLNPFLTMALGFAWMASFQMAVLIGVSNKYYTYSLPPALIQPFIGMLLITYFIDWLAPGYVIDFMTVLVILLFFIIFIGFAALWFAIIKIPFKRDFGVNSLDITKEGLKHFSEGRKGGMGLERFFESFGKPEDVSAGVLAFRRTGKTDKAGTKKKYKAVVVVPDAHKGPFGFLAGSNMPEKIKVEIGDLAEEVLVPHGTATHDFNPVNSEETSRIGRAVKDALNGLKPDQFSSSGSRMVRASAGKGVNISLQYLGDAPVGMYTSSPEPSDDIDQEIGAIARKTIRGVEHSLFDVDLDGNPIGNPRKKTASDPVLIDAHNCMEAGEGYVHYKSKKYYELMSALSDAVKKTSGTKVSSGLKLGLAQGKGFTVEDHGLGPMGIQVMVVETPPSHRVGYILFDGNNLQPGLREYIINYMKKNNGMDDIEVLTSDNHVVNMTFGGYLPVGTRFNWNELNKVIERLFKQAVSDIEPVEVASTRAMIKNLKVFGRGNTLKLTTTINNSMKLIGQSFAACFGTAFVLAFALLILF